CVQAGRQPYDAGRQGDGAVRDAGRHGKSHGVLDGRPVALRRKRRMADVNEARVGRHMVGWPSRSLLALALAPVVAVAATLVVMHLVGLTGVDTAGHVYKTALVTQGQSLTWDNLWYGGSYGVAGYGVVYYVLARFLGEAPIVVAAAGLLPLLFHLYVRRGRGGLRGGRGRSPAAGPAPGRALCRRALSVRPGLAGSAAGLPRPRFIPGPAGRAAQVDRGSRRRGSAGPAVGRPRP